jgi:hypothetical protein
VNPTPAQAHQQLLVLGLEVVVILGLATVAEAAPGWGPILVMLFVLLWALFLFTHSEQLKAVMGFLP